MEKPARYKRPRNSRAITKTEKVELLKEYSTEYEALAKADPSTLNRKVSREAFSEFLNLVGVLLTERSVALTSVPGPVRDFLDSNPVPGKMAALLPDSLRVFCLGLNSLKQWVVAEQAAMDRYLLGGKARELCREAFDHCLATGKQFSGDVKFTIPLGMGARQYRCARWGTRRSRAKRRTQARSRSRRRWSSFGGRRIGPGNTSGGAVSTCSAGQSRGSQRRALPMRGRSRGRPSRRRVLTMPRFSLGWRRRAFRETDAPGEPTPRTQSIL